MMDNLKTSLLFRMLDLFLKVLAFGSAPKARRLPSPRFVVLRTVFASGQNMWSGIVATMNMTSNRLASLRSVAPIAAAPATLTHLDENVLTLSPKLLAKALAKAPLVDLLQIFSDCTLDEREHILSALRCAPLLGVEPKKSVIPSEIVPGELKISTLADGPDCLVTAAPDDYLAPTRAYGGSRSEAPPGALIISPHAQMAPSDLTWDDSGHLDKLLNPQKIPISDDESGMGIDRDAFIRWVDGDSPSLEPELRAWDPPLPLFEDMPKSPPSRELRSFVMGRDAWTDDDDFTASGAPPAEPAEQDLSTRLILHEPPQRELRSLPPDIPYQRTTVQTLREKPDDWHEFQPLYSELNLIRKRFRDAETSPPPVKRIGASPHLDTLDTSIPPHTSPPAHVRDRYTPPWSSTGHGSPPGRPSSGGPPPVPLPRRGRGSACHRSRLNADLRAQRDKHLAESS